MPATTSAGSRLLVPRGLQGEMQRVLVIGISGAGKTTLSQALAERTGLPLIHLDREFWQPAGWRRHATHGGRKSWSLPPASAG